MNEEMGMCSGVPFKEPRIHRGNREGWCGLWNSLALVLWLSGPALQYAALDRSGSPSNWLLVLREVKSESDLTRHYYYYYLVAGRPPCQDSSAINPKVNG